MFEASGHPIPTLEKVEIVLAGLSLNFDSVITLALFSFEPTYEEIGGYSSEVLKHRQQRVVTGVPFQANMVSSTESVHAFPMVSSSPRGGQAFYGGRGWISRGHVQCQICGYLEHLAQHYYYRFDRLCDGPLESVSSLVFKMMLQQKGSLTLILKLIWVMHLGHQLTILTLMER